MLSEFLPNLLLGPPRGPEYRRSWPLRLAVWERTDVDALTLVDRGTQTALVDFEPVLESRSEFQAVRDDDQH